MSWGGHGRMFGEAITHLVASEREDAEDSGDI